MLPRLQAEKQLLTIEAVLVPHMKPADSARVVGRYQRRFQRAKPKSLTEELIGAGFKTVFVPKTPEKGHGTRPDETRG
jgi:hypothetical protein